MNTLLIIGVIILLGMVGARVFRKLNLPGITGYMVIGLVLGESFGGFLSGSVISESFSPLISLALGIIGFMIGSELRFDRFKKYSRSIYTILFAETLVTFFLVATVTTLLTQKVYIGLVLGAIASATAPAATYSVLGEYKARGPVTMTTLSIVALDDALALLLYGFMSVFAKSLIIHETPSFAASMMMPLFHIALSVVIGAASGFVLHKIASRQREREGILSVALGTILFVVGLSIYTKVDPILASMALGVTVSNLQPPEKREMFDLIKKLSPPVFILFFVLVGARLDARILMKTGVLVLALAYIISRGLGKITGAYIGGKISGAKNTVTKYLGFCLFDQAGVAVGLGIAVFQMFNSLGPEARAAGILVISIVTATTFLLQLVSPAMIKYGIRKADEINRDVTEDDIIAEHKVGDVMEKEFPVLKENDNLHQIMDVMKKSDAYNFPVVALNGDFIGIISLGEIRDTFYEEQMDQLILAEDIVRKVDIVAYVKQELKTVMDIFNTKNIGYIPVLEKEGSCKLVGQLEYRKLGAYIAKEVLFRQQEIEA